MPTRTKAVPCRGRVAKYGLALLLIPALSFAQSAPLTPVAPATPAPTYHALLIGVSAYPALSESWQLQDGPRNDVVLLRNVLQEKGFRPERITVLADGVDGAAGLPTRAAILDRLTALSERVQPGDFAVVYYSGHGSQQPVTAATAASETDGLDETLLPRDVGKWNNSVGVVENAIVDNEIESRLTALRQRGAFVWAVFDSCHSATVTRNGPPEGWRDRGVPPTALGIPAAALNPMTPRGAGGAGAREAGPAFAATPPATAGGYVAFFAAQSNELTPQLGLPTDDPQRKTHGLLTYTLAAALARLPPGVSYRQIGEQVAREYVAGRYSSPTPDFEGDRLDAPVFGQALGERVQQWPLQRRDGQLTLAAGHLHGLGEGARLAVVAGPAATEPLGYLTVTSADLLSSQLAPQRREGQQEPAFDPATLPRGIHARLLNSPLRLTLRVAPPLEEGQLPPHTAYTAEERQARTTLMEALAKAAARTEGLRIALTSPTENADAMLRLQDGHLWLLGPGAEWVTEGPRRAPSIAVTNPQALAGVVETHLQPLAKALNLLRLAGQVNEATSALQLEVEVARQAQGAADFQKIEFKPGAAPTLNPGDRLQITVKNASQAPLDVTVLYIDSRYGITPIYGGGENRLLPGNQAKMPEGTIDANTTGLEQMLFIATRAAGPRQDFTYLAQAGVPEAVRAGPAETVQRGSPQGELLAFENMLLRAGFGHEAIAKRGLTLTNPAHETALLRVLQWQVAAPGSGHPIHPVNDQIHAPN